MDGPPTVVTGRPLLRAPSPADVDPLFAIQGDARAMRFGAFTKPENVASARVLRKTGFSLVRHVPELERDQYVVARRDWQGAS